MSLRSFGYVLKSAADTGDCLTTKLFSCASVCDTVSVMMLLQEIFHTHPKEDHLKFSEGKLVIKAKF